MKTYVFVCSGNIIRSAFAHLYAQHIGIKNVDSIATTYKNQKIHPETKKQLLKLGIPEEKINKFKPKQISQFKIPQNPMFIVMTEKHKQQLISKGIPEDKIKKITQFIGKNNDIADPYWTRRFTHAFKTIKECVQALKKEEASK